ncbi:hypothetical protein F4778DRAFT_802119 [Xylariomycetidae sp. FL2044]|nr:hypothetical protein F4778DRAFT_802119 [Xylariomycetidae sp. FL2044]
MTSLADVAGTLAPCAVACLGPAIANSSCLLTDLACVCHSEALSSQGTACILSTCGKRDQLAAANAMNTLCGVEPTVDHSYIPIMIVFIILTGIIVVMRLLTRMLMDLPLWWDDWANFVKNGGWGTDIWAVPADNIEDQLIGYYALAVVYVVARLLIRISIILFYIRVFRASHSEYLIWGTFYVSLLVTVPLVLTAIFECTPVSYFWTRWDGQADGYCVNQKALLWAGWTTLLVYDLWIMGVPMRAVARLQLSKRKKTLVGIMFSTGLVVIAISIYKLTLIDQYTRRTNPTVDTVPMGAWAAVEIDLGVICACMPSIPVLFRPLVQRIRGTRPSAGSSSFYPRRASRYGKMGLRRSTTSTQGASLPRATEDSNHGNHSRVRMVTTIEQTEETAQSGSQAYVDPSASIEMYNMGGSNVRAQAWA